MSTNSLISRQFKITKDFGPNFISLIVLLNGVFIIAFSLIDQLADNHRLYVRLNDVSLDITLILGLSLIYLGSVLRRRKKTALIATVIAYSIYFVINIETLMLHHSRHHHSLNAVIFIRDFIFPAAVVGLLYINRKKYVVRSDGSGFLAALRLSLIIIVVSFVYGTIGFYILAKDDFHQQLSLPASMHYTVDQIGLTTNHPIHAYTRQAKLFQDSLTFISIVAVTYIVLSFFQPLKSRFADHTLDRDRIREQIISQHDATSEDFFKLWPHDKQYFFDSTGESGLAYHVYRGIAVILGGPTGKQARFKQLLSEFQYVCYGNDWKPAILHCEDKHRDIFEELGYIMQMLGQEAILDLEEFNNKTVKNKYFRNVVNRFNKKGYSYQVLTPPHSSLIMNQLRNISDEWLSTGSRSERGFAMGYFTASYLNQCSVLVAKDEQGEIQAFLNLIPEKYDYVEATYDLLRYSKGSLGNVNDFLLISLIAYLSEQGYTRLNLGLCPLAGIDESEQKNSRIIDSVMGFAYANGDRIYSFSGLYRFKNKYGPKWSNRYLAYQGGIRGFSRSINAVVQIMRITSKPSFADRISDRIRSS